MKQEIKERRSAREGREKTLHGSITGDKYHRMNDSKAD